MVMTNVSFAHATVDGDAQDYHRACVCHAAAASSASDACGDGGDDSDDDDDDDDDDSDDAEKENG